MFYIDHFIDVCNDFISIIVLIMKSGSVKEFELFVIAKTLKSVFDERSKMGIKGLWSVLEPVAKRVTLDDLKGLKVGIDGPFWMAQAKSTSSNMKRFFYLRIVKLRQVGVAEVVVVFDGAVKPDLKTVTLQERRYNRSRYGKPRYFRSLHET